ncbi:hypothetical protein QBC46DRAFT_424025 [Diplogelasinospora grovesii]|uniref:Mid2 domain-containing protein n=1 Tax=Diplogelasinospora grovesii TaxID=303347 RepID=A0AAN6S745_9PEZI|nr:hypothetical protein QBC46DRAFT_424025 [Diplogelasinospora grovesii]
MRPSRDSSRPARVLNLSLFLLGFLSGVARSDCYFPDSSPATTEAECWDSSGARTGLCCAAGDLCLNNTMCAHQIGTTTGISGNNITHYRGGCTDSTWSPLAGCPEFCLSDDSHKKTGGPITVYQCPGGLNRWYCGLDVPGPLKSCAHVRITFGLTGDLSVYGVAGISPSPSSGQPPPSPSPSNNGSTPDQNATSTPTAISTDTSSSAASPTVSLDTFPQNPFENNGSESSQVDTSVGVPIAIGIAMGTAIFVAAAVLGFFYIRKRRREAPARAETPPPYEEHELQDRRYSDQYVMRLLYGKSD